MEKVIINSYEDFEKLVGQQIGVCGTKSGTYQSLCGFHVGSSVDSR